VIQYEDDYGPGQESEDLHLNVYGNNNTALVIGVAVLLIVAGIIGYWYFIMRRKPGTGNV